MKFIFAGDRDISVWVLQAMLDFNLKPSALIITESSKATHSQKLIDLSGLPPEYILEGKAFESPDGIALMRNINPDFIFGIHFPYFIRQEVLEIPRKGFLNLHPSFLPFNRGWHTPSWAILEKTPIGATLHFMAQEIDNGDVIHQKRLEILPNDTANSLYIRLKKLELQVFIEALPSILSGDFKRKSLNLNQGTIHKRKDLFKSTVQKIELNESYCASELIDKIRALTTNQWVEAAYFEKNGEKFRVRIEIIKDEF
jgi:methionyl-tRNA formyltransferase